MSCCLLINKQVLKGLEKDEISDKLIKIRLQADTWSDLYTFRTCSGYSEVCFDSVNESLKRSGFEIELCEEKIDDVIAPPSSRVSMLIMLLGL